jgi:DNA-binding transcriptional regulator YhcF (GntR family)
MRRSFLIPYSVSSIEHNIYANKSALILYWLLFKGIEKPLFSIREAAKECDVSIGLIQRVFKILVLKGYLKTKGIRTSKKFILEKPYALLKSWQNQYNIMKKCKMWTYKSAFQNKKQILQELIKSNFQKKVFLALHSATEIYKCKNTNLDTLELYLMEPSLKSQIEKKLLLKPQERGYEVLLIEPYYKSMLKFDPKTTKYLKISKKNLFCSPIFLTFLDLYNFPLRGREQAEFMIEKIKELKKIYKRKN